ncbi:MAG: ammonia-forming cytochrome c nitrite reductase subunit c552 [Phycisphaeraceae bacterium]|nr:ammonia-forming cytochrome c nitrite reductase subunit c552 [Phycisphaeraceae bacterium]
MSEESPKAKPQATSPESEPTAATPRAGMGGRKLLVLGSLLVVTLLATLIVTYTLVTMFEHRQDARSPFAMVVQLDETSVNPRLWALNFPHHYDEYLLTAGDQFRGGSESLPESKLDQMPWLKRLFAGYAFALDYREARGHAYMLHDQMLTERVHQRKQAGACLHCHSSTTVLYRKAGLEAMGLPADDAALAREFNMEAVIKGFEVLSQVPYHDALEKLKQMPDGVVNRDGTHTPHEFTLADLPEGHEHIGGAHPVSCIDCHDPKTMELRITRPGFMLGIAALAESDDPLPHMPSVNRWRRGDRKEPYDPNRLATRQEMRSFVCGHCHEEYYCADRATLVFPWGHGLKAEDLERYWEEKKFPDGTPFYDYKHAETGAPLFKAQHPEFELWSQGIHARSGVSCSDCHMPYERRGAMKLSNHNVRSPMENINNACQTCHNVSEQELRERVTTIQDRTVQLKERAAQAMVEMLDAILEAQAAGVTDEQLAQVFVLQRRSMWRLDYIVSENSKGFHASQEAARILGESIDYSRKAQSMALRLRAPDAPEIDDRRQADPPPGATIGDRPEE